MPDDLLRRVAYVAPRGGRHRLDHLDRDFPGEIANALRLPEVVSDRLQDAKTEQQHLLRGSLLRRLGLQAMAQRVTHMQLQQVPQPGFVHAHVVQDHQH